MSQPKPRISIAIIPVTPLQQNTSLVWDTETMEGVFIDPGGETQKLMGALDHYGVKLKKIWLTHGHLDHAGAADEIRELTGAP
ncbi:MAG: MBL fold metallo-hydrolase, partial [Pseudomonadota bacterium]